MSTDNTYKWRAIYENGEYIDEYKQDGTPNKYFDIDRERLRAFEFYKNGKLVYRLHLEEGQTLIYRKRVIADYNCNPLMTFYMIGWQQKINGKNVQSIIHMVDDEDSPIVQTGRWVGEPELIQQEKDSLVKSSQL